MFCPQHTREYNKGYNFASNLSDPVTARYQKDAASGSRKTWGTRVDHVTEMPLPSTVRSGTAKPLTHARLLHNIKQRKPISSDASSRYWKQKPSKRSAFRRTRRLRRLDAAISRCSNCTIPTPTEEIETQKMSSVRQSTPIRSSS